MQSFQFAHEPLAGSRRRVTRVNDYFRIEEVYSRFGNTAHFVYDEREADEISTDGTGLPPVHGPFNSDRRAREFIALCEFGRA